jgi:hypothetical protein
METKMAGKLDTKKVDFLVKSMDQMWGIVKAVLSGIESVVSTVMQLASSTVVTKVASMDLLKEVTTVEK